MKKLLFVFMILSIFAMTAKANEDVSSNVFADVRLKEISKALAGRKISCGLEKGASAADGFFPVSVKMKAVSADKTSIVVSTNDGSTFAGSGEYLSAEGSKSWLILKDGDDGYNQLLINLFAEDGSVLENPSAIFSFQSNDGTFSTPKALVCEVK